MKKQIQEFQRQIQELLEKNAPDTDWAGVREELLTRIGFYQHERLIHLIVTVLFAILEVLVICTSVITESWLITKACPSGKSTSTYTKSRFLTYSAKKYGEGRREIG